MLHRSFGGGGSSQTLTPQALGGSSIWGQLDKVGDGHESASQHLCPHLLHLLVPPQAQGAHRVPLLWALHFDGSR